MVRGWKSRRLEFLSEMVHSVVVQCRIELSLVLQLTTIDLIWWLHAEDKKHTCTFVRVNEVFSGLTFHSYIL